MASPPPAVLSSGKQRCQTGVGEVASWTLIRRPLVLLFCWVVIVGFLLVTRSRVGCPIYQASGIGNWLGSRRQLLRLRSHAGRQWPRRACPVLGGRPLRSCLAVPVLDALPP